MIFGLPDLFFGLIVGIVVGGIVELSILWFAGRRWIPNRSAVVYNEKAAAGDLDEARDHFIEPIQKEIAALKADTGANNFSQELEDFEARFTSAYTEDMLAIQAEMKEIPLRVSGMIHGQDGVEEKAFRRMAEAAETEVEGEISVMEAVASQNPEMTQIAIAQKIQKLGSDEKWQKEHQIGSLILEIGKPTLLNWVQEMTRQMQGTPRLGPGNTTARKQFSSPYG